MDIQASPSDPAHGEISVFVPKYKVNYTVPVVSEGSVSVNPYRDGSRIHEDDWGSIFPLASPESVDLGTPSSYVTLKASDPVVSDDEFLMNVYRWYMAPVTSTPPAKRDLILIKEWNAARAPLSFEDSEDMTYIPNVEANYDELDFRDFFSYLGLSEEELCKESTIRSAGGIFTTRLRPTRRSAGLASRNSARKSSRQIKSCR